MKTDNEEWKPKVGDWFISRASYCAPGEGCTEEDPCPECLEMCNRWVISAEHCGTDFFFGGGWCNRSGGCRLDETYCFVLTTDREKADRGMGVVHISEVTPIPPPVPVDGRPLPPEPPPQPSADRRTSRE